MPLVAHARRLTFAAILLAAFASAVPLTTSAQASFGFEQLGLTFASQDGSAASRAGSHPFAWTTELSVNTVGEPGADVPDGALNSLRIQLPPGLVGTPALLPRCSRADLAALTCPASSEVGEIELVTDLAELDGEHLPLYSVEPRIGAAAELVFMAQGVPVPIVITIDPNPPHNLVASILNAPNAAAFFGSTLTIWGTPGAKPFLTLPRNCSTPLAAAFEATSWEAPGTWTPPAWATAYDDSTPPAPLVMTGCEELDFEPTAEARPTTGAAAASSGLDLGLDLPVDGLVSPEGSAQADVRQATLRLPDGMTVNPSIAEGLGVCTPTEYAGESLDPTREGCPDGSKIGSVEAESPLLEEPVKGSVFVAQPDVPETTARGAENPFDSLFALYVVLENPRLGILLKQALRVDADPGTGSLAATSGELPPLPFSRLALSLRGGPRGPLVTPPSCGPHAIELSLSPSSGAPALNRQSAFALDSECAAPGFRPRLLAGTTRPLAGAPSPFALSLTRAAGEQSLSALSLTLAPGLSANFGAVPRCPESSAATGGCPADSRVGSVDVVVGGSSIPLSIPVPGRPPGGVYLAGPYRGAPFSLVIALGAQAGPFDLGPVVTRTAVFVDRATGRARIRLDPLPPILDGVPIGYRALHLVLDRPGFILNPTSCAESSSNATVTSVAGAVAGATDRFQVGGCPALGFKPRASVRLLGPTHRGAHPRLRAVLATRPADANIRRVAVTLPATELLDSRRIGAVCTVRQFDAMRCPPGSVYGQAKAWTRLLDRPLQGPVYLRESKSRLPDLVASLRGQIQLDLVSRVDSVGGRLRIIPRALPDAPLSKVVLTTQGGKRGLLVNTGGLCARPRRAAIDFMAQSGKRHYAAVVVRTDCEG
jgi:hypothetical protein